MSKHILYINILVAILATSATSTAFAQATEAEIQASNAQAKALADRKAAETKAIADDTAALTKEVADQKAAQQAAADKAKKSSQMAQLLGQGLQATGMVTMMAAQMSETPETKQMLMKMGIVLSLGGVAANMAGGAMAMNANSASANTSALDSLTNTLGSTPPPGNTGNTTGSGFSTGTSTNLGTGTSNISSPGLIAVNPADLYKPPLDAPMTNLEKATGMTRDAFSNAIASGKTAADLLDGKMGFTKDGINSMMAKAKSELGTGGPNVQALAEKAGLGDLAKKLAEDTGADFSGGGGALAGGGSSGASSLPPLDFGNMMPQDTKPEAPRGPAAETAFDFKRDVNPEIQKQLVAQGVVQGSLFDMISTRYRFLTPSILGYGPTERKKN